MQQKTTNKLRIEENFNRDWLFAYGEQKGAEAKGISEDGWCPIALPHSFSIPYDLNDDKFYVGTGWYRKEFFIPSDWIEKFITIEFEGVFQRTDIYINGVKIPKNKVYGYEHVTDLKLPTHEGGYSAFSVNITDHVVFGKENTIAVKVDNIWQADLTPRGGDHQFSGGIYRDVTITAVNKTHIDWFGNFVWTPAICNPAFQKSENRPDELYNDDFERNGTGIINTLDDTNVEGEYVTEEVMLENLKQRKSNVEVRSEITNTSAESVTVYTINSVIDADLNVVSTFKSDNITLAAGERKTVTARSEMINNVKLWDFETPNLYTLKTVVYTQNGTAIDENEVTFGFRSAQFKLDGFYLNGVRTLLDGANVHQDHGGWADAVTDMGFYRDVKYVKDLGFNFIRGSHYPHDSAFTKACDELGIGFWSEGGLWSIGGSNDNDTVSLAPSDWARTAYPKDEKSRAKLEQSCFDLVRSMIRVNRNSPSVIVWSMGNEAFFSSDDVTVEVKKLVNELRNYAHSLDFTRKAGLGGTQRKDLNTLAVSDVAGGNGDGGTERYTNFYLPHIVAEYSSGKNDRPGAEDFQYGEIIDRNNPKKYILPERTITLNDGSEVLSKSAGLSIWCMYHHGSIGGRSLRIMGLMDYYRLPTTRYYMYRKDRLGLEMPVKSVEGKAKGITLRASTDTMHVDDRKQDKHIITNDGKSDIQIIVTMVDENGNWVNDNKAVTIKVMEGNGIFPTGKEYRFIPDLTIQDGKAAIEFRSYYAGETKIQAFVDGEEIASDVLTVTTVKVMEEKGVESESFMIPEKPFAKKALEEPEVYGKIDVANNRQSRAESASENHLPINAIDGKTDTYWESEIAGNNQCWWVFLENSYYVYKVRLNTPSKKFDLYYQTITSEWVHIGNYENYFGEEINIDGIYTNGLKVIFRDIEEADHARLYSFNAYGTAFQHFNAQGEYLADTINANGETVYKTEGKYSHFTVTAAINEENQSSDVAVFRIYGTIDKGKETEASLLLFEEKIADRSKPVSADISIVDVDEICLTANARVKTAWHNPVLWGAVKDISTKNGRVEACRSEGYVHVRIDENCKNATAELVESCSEGKIALSKAYKFDNAALSIKTECKQAYLIVKDNEGTVIGMGTI